MFFIVSFIRGNHSLTNVFSFPLVKDILYLKIPTLWVYMNPLLHVANILLIVPWTLFLRFILLELDRNVRATAKRYWTWILLITLHFSILYFLHWLVDSDTFSREIKNPFWKWNMLFTIVINILWRCMLCLEIALHSNLFLQEWPINGGNWGLGSQSYPEIIITG